MEAQIAKPGSTTAVPTSPLLLGLAAFAAAGLLAALLILQFAPDTTTAPAPPIWGDEHVAYLEFGRHGDTLWLASVSAPNERRRVLEIPHAADYGAVAALSPDGTRVAYTVLPTASPRIAADAPATLYVAPVDGGAAPRELATGVDLLVKPAWRPDGESVVVRRSGAEYSLVEVSAAGEERTLLSSPDALFPAGFAADGDLYAVRLSNAASDLLRLPAGAASAEEIGRLASGLSRDWVLSPDGSRLAYLEITGAGASMSSRLRVLDLRTLAPMASGDSIADFGPAWSADGGTLSVARLGSIGAPAIASIGAQQELAAPERGFDVPLAWSPRGLLAVRSFSGDEAGSPGASALSVVSQRGRTTLTLDEVTFIGWIRP